MWLINAANEDTRKAVASYFNPVRLAELNRKGIQNPHNQSESPEDKGEKTTEESAPGDDPPPAPPPAARSSADVSRDALFKDPYKVLAEIAAKPGPNAPAAGGEGESGVGALAGGPGAGGVFRDLFDPDFRQSLGDAAKTERPAPGGAVAAPVADQLRLSTPESAPPRVEPQPAVAMSPNPAAAAPASLTMPAPRPVDVPNVTPSAGSAQLAAELSAAVEKETGSGRSPKVSVEETGEGTMISLTDDADFGMFGIGSAEPQPQMVRIMERIAAILKTRSGSITIRGHTDARPFRTAAYDNWRLSTDRAQMAYYMLVRGGLDEKRVDAIEGYADRRLKAPADPEAAENRRIEILLREASS